MPSARYSFMMRSAVHTTADSAGGASALQRNSQMKFSIVSTSLARSTALVLLAGAAIAGCNSRHSDKASSAQPEAAHLLPTSPSTATSTAVPASTLANVPDRSLVCMVNNQYMGREQIPVQVEGRTYYGCCPMCKDRLTTDKNARTARDPVSGKDVDKAVAVIGKTASGAVLYFESEANLKKYAGG
jgi:YHS domain-containing protein